MTRFCLFWTCMLCATIVYPLSPNTTAKTFDSHSILPIALLPCSCAYCSYEPFLATQGFEDARFQYPALKLGSKPGFENVRRLQRLTHVPFRSKPAKCSRTFCNVKVGTWDSQPPLLYLSTCTPYRQKHGSLYTKREFGHFSNSHTLLKA